MKLEKSFLTSKVARRIFTVFILCALIPIIAVSGISYFQVSKDLKNQGKEQLYNSTRIHGLSVYDRFLYLETVMNILQSTLKSNEPHTIDPEKIIGKKALGRFEALALVNSNQSYEAIHGTIEDFPFGSLAEPSKGRTRILFKNNPDAPSSVFMAMPMTSKTLETDYLVGEVVIGSLWGVGHENSLPAMTDLCIMTQFRKVLISSFSINRSFQNQVMVKNDGRHSNFFTYTDNDETYYVSFRPLFLQSGFDSPNIHIVLRQAESLFTRPINEFKLTFPLVVLLTIWIILFLSLSFIRKSLTPLEALAKGTRRLADKDFKTPVIVDSNDEFQDLADSFNQMSTQLGRHFQAVTSRSEIDRAVLSSLNIKKIVNTAMRQMYRFFGCDVISINVMMEKKTDTFHGYILKDLSIRKTKEEYFTAEIEDLKQLDALKKHSIVNLAAQQPSYLTDEAVQDMSVFLVAPISFDSQLRGFIALGFKDVRTFSDEELTQVRQVTDQVGEALSNSSLVSALKKLNLGTLEALARTVDAKSAWTAGHSERVMSLAVRIAEVMGWNDREIEALKRGAYLHDIGKIGIPLTILDKPERLNEEEYEIVKEHPSIGARILEPIDAYSDVIPVVLQHHERFDGTGYPNGLSGEDISMGARILAVADVYDAVASDRPYRQGWIEEKAVDLIRDNSGSHFDPAVVDAFLTTISESPHD